MVLQGPKDSPDFREVRALLECSSLETYKLPGPGLSTSGMTQRPAAHMTGADVLTTNPFLELSLFLTPPANYPFGAP